MEGLGEKKNAPNITIELQLQPAAAAEGEAKVPGVRMRE